MISNTFKRLVRDYAFTAACVLVMAGCGGSEDGTPATVTEIRFDGWDAFVSSGERAGVRPGPVVVVGIDGAAWWWIDQLIERGELPNLARIKREGAYATLRSTRAYVTPPAWTSMFTGYLPGATGIYAFGKWKSETHEFLSVNSDDVKVPFVWEVASMVGAKAGVFNVPMTFPVRPINGAMVSGMMTPIEAMSAIDVTVMPDDHLRSMYKSDQGVLNHLRPVRAALEDSLNVFLFVAHDTSDDGETNYDHVSLRILSKASADAASPELGVYTFDVGKYSQWFPIRYNKNGVVVPAWSRAKLDFFSGTEFRVEYCQTVFPIEVPYAYPDELHGVLADRFAFYLPTKFLPKEVVPTVTEDMAEYASFFYDRDDWDLFNFVFTQSDNVHHVVGYTQVAAQVYKTIDRAIGNIVAKMPAGGTLIVASDHGNGTYKFAVDLNKVFTRLKLLEWKSLSEIDYENTLVFHNLWHVYFNHDKITRGDLAKRGIMVPLDVEPYDYLVMYITEAGRQFRGSRAGRPFPLEFHPVADRQDDDDPDMWVLGSYEDYIIDYWNIMNPHATMVRIAEGSDQYWHNRDGIFLAWGDHVRRGYDAGVKDIQDVAPTMLYLAGLPVAPDMDGTFMMDIFNSDFVTSRPLFINSGYRDIPREPMMNMDERESLQKKLKSLGYIQ